MPFLSGLVGRALPGNRWRLDKPLIYSYSNGTGDVTLTVPAGFITDLASIPPPLTPFLPVNDDHRAAAALHDYLYFYQPVSRDLADYIFLRAMVDLGVPRFKRALIYAGVRAGGWVEWGRHQRRIKSSP